MKYQTDICIISNCPPSSCVQEKRTAYRFVYDPMGVDSFLPQGKKDPQRAHDCNNNEIKCSFFAVSMFTSEKGALDKYKKLKKQVKNIDKAIGSHLAKGTLDIHHGVLSEPSNSGHFDFFERSGVDLTKQFQTIYKL